MLNNLHNSKRSERGLSYPIRLYIVVFVRSGSWERVCGRSVVKCRTGRVSNSHVLPVKWSDIGDVLPCPPAPSACCCRKYVQHAQHFIGRGVDTLSTLYASNFIFSSVCVFVLSIRLKKKSISSSPSCLNLIGCSTTLLSFNGTGFCVFVIVCFSLI